MIPLFDPEEEDIPCRRPDVDLNDYFPDTQPTRRHLQKCCGGCPVILQCRQHAQKYGEIGVWGGKHFARKY